MTIGTIGVIACPMLEDELIYNISSDKEEKYVYIVDNDAAKTIKMKMEKYGIDYTLINEIEFNTSVDVDHSKFNIVIFMNSMGLHEEPKDLKAKVEDQVIMAQGKFDILMLFYGLCGNYGWDVSKWAKDVKNIPMPVTVFRDNEGKVCDDCICVAVGGSKQYLKLIKKYTGMLFLTPSMATNWEDFLGSNDMFKGCEKTDYSQMKWILEMCGYQYAVKVDTGLGDRDNYQKCAEALCKAMNLKLITAENGWVSLAPTKKIYEDSKNLLN